MAAGDIITGQWKDNANVVHPLRFVELADGTLAQAAASEFSMVGVDPVSVTVTSTAAIKSAARATRLGVLFLNIGAQIVYVGHTDDVSPTTGFPMAVGTGTYAVDEHYRGDIWMVTASGSSDVRRQEL